MNNKILEELKGKETIFIIKNTPMKGTILEIDDNFVTIEADINPDKPNLGTVTMTYNINVINSFTTDRTGFAKLLGEVNGVVSESKIVGG